MLKLEKIQFTLDNYKIKLKFNECNLTSGYVKHHDFNKDLFIINEIHEIVNGEYKVSKNLITNNYGVVRPILARIRDENILGLQVKLIGILF